MGILGSMGFGLGGGALRGAVQGFGISALAGGIREGDQSQFGGILGGALGGAAGRAGMNFALSRGLMNPKALPGANRSLGGAAIQKYKGRGFGSLLGMGMLAYGLPLLGGYVGATALESNQPRNKIRTR